MDSLFNGSSEKLQEFINVAYYIVELGCCDSRLVNYLKAIAGDSHSLFSTLPDQEGQ